MHRFNRLLVDLAPLRESAAYRWLFTGQSISLIGQQLTAVALPYQVYLLTHSSLAVGMIGLAQLGPSVFCTLAGGTLADAYDRRRILLVTQVLLALLTAALALNASQARPPLWLLFVLVAFIAGVAGINGPTQGAATRSLVQPDLFPAAAALNALLRQVGAVAGPALAGVIISRLSLPTAYWIDAITYGATILALLAIQPLPPQGGGRRAGLAAFVEGWRFLRGRPVLQGALLVDLDAVVFGMPGALFPALGTGVFGGNAQTVGLLYAAPAAGALLGAALSGWVGTIKLQGRAVLIAATVWGAAIVAFGLVTWLPLALACLALAGAADIISEVFRSSILQLATPDALRGRLTAIWLAQASSAPRLGDAEAGLVAGLTTPQFSVVSGGVACVAGVALLAWLLPAFRAYQPKVESEAAASSRA